jgi:hypothetical protein
VPGRAFVESKTREQPEFNGQSLLAMPALPIDGNEGRPFREVKDILD